MPSPRPHALCRARSRPQSCPVPGLGMAAVAAAQTQCFVAGWTVALRDVTARGRSQDNAESSPLGAEAAAVVPPPLSALTGDSEAVSPRHRESHVSPQALLRAVLEVLAPVWCVLGGCTAPRAGLGEPMVELLLSLVALSLRGAGIGFGFTACCTSHLEFTMGSCHGTCFLPMDLGQQGCVGNTSVRVCGCVCLGRSAGRIPHF